MLHIIAARCHVSDLPVRTCYLLRESLTGQIRYKASDGRIYVLGDGLMSLREPPTLLNPRDTIHYGTNAVAIAISGEPLLLINALIQQIGDPPLCARSAMHRRL